MVIKCEICSVGFNKPRCHIKRNKHHFCSIGCRNKWQSINFSGDKNPRWKGDEAGYVSLHAYIKKRLIKPTSCQNCNKNEKLDLANKSKNYTRNLDDWMWICRTCHYHYDRNTKLQTVFIGRNMQRKQVYLSTDGKTKGWSFVK
jgi:hypothetical protein